MRACSKGLRCAALAVLIGLAAIGCGPTRAPDYAFGPHSYDFFPDLQTAAPENPWRAWFEGRTDDALVGFEALSPDDPVALFGRAEIALQRGRYRDAFERFYRLLQVAPEHPLAALSAAQLLGSGRTLLTAAEPLPEVRALDWSRFDSLTRRYLAARAREEAEEQAQRAQQMPFDATPYGKVDHWRWVGPFSLFESADWGHDFPPDDGTPLATTYDWQGQRLETREQDGGLTQAYPSDGIYYAEAYIEVSEVTEVLISVHCYVSYDLSVDGQPALNRWNGDGPRAALSARKMVFEPGRHQLLVKLAVVGESKLWLDLTPSTGRPPFALSRSEPGPISDSTLGETVSVDGGLPKPSELAGDPWRLFLAALWARESWDAERARAVFERIKELSPRIPRLLVIESEMLRHFDGSDERLRALETLQEALLIDPRAADARMDLAKLLTQQGQHRQALDQVDIVLEQDSTSTRALKLRFDILTSLKWWPLREQAAASLLEQAPYDCDVALLALPTVYSVDFSPDAIDPRVAHCIDVRNYVGGQYYSYVDTDRFLATFEQIAREYPSPEHYDEYADALMRLGEFERALEFYEARVAKPPVGGWVMERVDVLNLLGRHDENLALLEAQDPTNSTYRDLILYFGGPTPRVELRGQDGLERIAEYLSEPREEYGDQVMVLDRTEIFVYANGAQHRLQHQIVRPLTKLGLDTVGSVRFNGGGDMNRLRIVKPDGTYKDLPPKTGAVKGLELGDFLEVRELTVEKAVSPPSPRFTLPAHTFDRWDGPVFRSEFTVEVPTEVEPRMNLEGNAPEPEVSIVPEDPGRKQLLWVMNALPRRTSKDKAERASVALSNGFELETWRRDKRNALLRTRVVDDTMRDFADTFVANYPEPQTRAHALFDWVQNEVESGRSDDTLETWRSKKGDRLELLVALLDAAELPSEVCLMQRFGSKPLEDYPFVSPPNTRAIRVEGDEKVLWLNPALDFAPFDLLGPSLQEQTALCLGDEAKTVLTERYDPERERLQLALTLDMDATGAAKGTLTYTMRGFSKASALSWLKELEGDEEKSYESFSMGLLDVMGDLVIASHEVTSSDEALILTFQVSTEAFAKPTPAGLDLHRRLFIGELRSGFADRAEVSSRLLVARELTDISLHLTLPAGSQLETQMTSSRHESRWASFAREVEIGEREIQISDRLELPQQEVSAEELPEFLNEMQKLDAFVPVDLQVQIPKTAL